MFSVRCKIVRHMKLSSSNSCIFRDIVCLPVRNLIFDNLIKIKEKVSKYPEVWNDAGTMIDRDRSMRIRVKFC